MSAGHPKPCWPTCHVSADVVQVLELPAEICNVMEVQYNPPGHISAGLTCQLNVVFTPKVSSAFHRLLSSGYLHTNLVSISKRYSSNATARYICMCCILVLQLTSSMGSVSRFCTLFCTQAELVMQGPCQVHCATSLLTAGELTYRSLRTLTDTYQHLQD